MWPFNTIKQNYHDSQIKDAHKQASDWITVSDFDGKLYIAYQSNPLILLEEDFTTNDILKKLQEVRDNYIDAKVKSL